MVPKLPQHLDLLVSNAVEVIPAEDLEKKLERSLQERRPLRVKLGLDPTAADVTLGWAVVLWKLRQFQDLGHTAVLIVGDFTARVGDPSGRAETRPRLSKEATRSFADRLLAQFTKIVRPDRLEVRYNSEWLEEMDMDEVLRLTASYTVARMLERDDFATRFSENRPISVLEFLYPLLQGRDSVAVEADVELGGTDQKFNLLVGRDVQREWRQEPQVALTMPLLEGLDGVQKMSQSLGNYVGITEEPGEMFGKLMRIPDELIIKYMQLCTALDAAQIDGMEAQLTEGSLRPDVAKRRMASAVVARYHGDQAAGAAEERFDLVHRDREIPDDAPEVSVPPAALVDGRVWLPRLLAELGMASSNADGRRLIEQGAVRIDGQAIDDPETELSPGELVGRVLSVGRRRFARIR